MMRVKSLLPRIEQASGQDRGSVTIWLVVFAIASLVLLGFIVDGGQYMNARERAADIAEQAARAGANQVSVADLRAGNFVIPQDAACAAAQSLVTSYASGSLSPTDAGATTMSYCNVTGPVVTVQVSVAVAAPFPLGTMFGTFTTGARESATLECGTNVLLTGAC
jgi:Flp pilus assembly protein TadG